MDAPLRPARCRSARSVRVARYGVRALRCTLPRHGSEMDHCDEQTGWRWPAGANRSTPIYRVWSCLGRPAVLVESDNAEIHGAFYSGTEDQARAAGWGIFIAAGRIDATCPACRGAPPLPQPVAVPRLSRTPMAADQPLPGI